MDTVIKIVVIDDEELMRDAMRICVSDVSDIDLVGEMPRVCPHISTRQPTPTSCS